MRKILTYVAAFSAAVLMFSACEKSGGETSGGTQEAEGYVQIDDNEKVNLSKAKIFNDGMSWRCVIYDSEKYTIDNLYSYDDIKVKDGAKGIVLFDWVIGDEFDPLVKGQYPTEKNLFFSAGYLDDPKVGHFWNFMIGEEQFPSEFNMQFSADRLEISYEGKYYYVNYEDFDAESRLGDAIFEFTGPYELVDLPHDGYYKEDGSFQKVNYCGYQKVGENDESIMYAVLLSPDAQNGTLTELPDRFIAVTYEYPKPASDYQNLQSYISSYRFSGNEIITDFISGYYPIPVQEMPELFMSVSAIERNGIEHEKMLFEVCFRGQGVEMQLPDSVIEECFEDAIEWL